MTALFDEIYVAGTLRELQFRGVRVAPGLTESELGAVETAIGAPLPPDLALLLHLGLPDGEGFPDWRGDPEGEARRARTWIARAFAFDIEAEQWWFGGWRPRPEDDEAAELIALARLAATPPLVPIYGHRFMSTDPADFGNPVLSVWQAVDSVYYGFDLAHYLHREFGVPRPPWSSRQPAPVPFWSDVLGLDSGGQDESSESQIADRTDDGQEWSACPSIAGPFSPDAVSAALGLQPSRVEVDTEVAEAEPDEGGTDAIPQLTWMLDSRLAIVAGQDEDVFEPNSLEGHILDLLDQLAGSWMRLVEVSGWPDVDIAISATLPLTSDVDAEDDADE
ncbi:MAG: hypothetical protein JOZ41_00380, partial [Chloroflexi bacterium]|nr:hypothetical protein [Chloroflexota bacterium]